MPFPKLILHRLGAMLLGAAALGGVLAGPATPGAAASTGLPAAASAAAHTAVPRAPLILRPRQAAASMAGRAGAQPLSPEQLRRAYALPSRGAAKQTIAIISAFADPTVQSDLAAYDHYFGLPACTEANGCLTVLNQSDKTSPAPSADPTGGTWVQESALGTEVAHGLCESCRIMLVEANFDDVPDFSYAALAAVHAGATVLVTSFTPSEPTNEDEYSIAYDARQVVTVAATGDNGYSGELNFPASLSGVVAAGGTTLTRGRGGGYGSESAWSGTVSGCSLYEPAPAYQSRILSGSGCVSRRAGVDVAAMAAPGAIIFASNIQGTKQRASYYAQGTSVSAPILGAVIGLAGSDGSGEAKMLYARAAKDPGGLHDVTSGADATDCTVEICRAGRGWDGPTGLGTPKGLEEFLPAGPVLSAKHPKLTLRPSGGRITLNRSWKGSFTLGNGNPFRIFGTATLRDTLAVGAHKRTYTFAKAPANRSSLQSTGVTLTIRSSTRSLLRSHRTLWAWLYVKVHGAQGRTVLVKHQVEVVAP